MDKRVVIFTVLLIYAISVSSFANGDQEKNGTERNVQENIAEPAFTGTIPVNETKVKDGSGLVALYKDKIVGLEQAGTAAVKAHPHSAVDGITLDIENGYLVYNVSMDDGTGMVVDAGTGKILHEKKHTASRSDEEGREQKEEDVSSENSKDSESE